MKKYVCGALAGILIIAGLILKFALVGYGFSALVLFGAAAVVIIMCALTARAEKSRAARVLSRVLAFVIAAGICVFAVSEAFVIKNARTDERAYGMKYVIVLGAGVNGTEPSLSLRNRLEAALDFLEKAPGATLVLSGGQGPGEQISEAECMRRWLAARGVAPERLILETRAATTRENIEFSLALIEQREGERPEEIAIVSSEYHLLRAKMQAKKLGVSDCAGVAARTTLPVLRVNYFIREGFGAAYEYLR